MGCKSSEKPKTKHRKGLWSPEEDQKLRNHVVKHGLGCWSSVPINAGLQRNGKSCRLRWINYLRPGLKRGMFTPQEEETILTLHHLLGNKWSQIAQSLPGRTDNEIKNHWHTYLKKRISKVEELEAQARTHYSSSSSENTESMVSPQNLTDQMPSFDSFQHIEKSSIISNELQISPVPKLLFAEWLSLDQESGSFSNSAKPAASSDGFNHVSTSNFQDPFMNNAYLLNEGALGSDLLDGLNDASVNELFSSQFISENEFVGSISGNDLWNDFNMNNDVMYI